MISLLWPEITHVITEYIMLLHHQNNKRDLKKWRSMKLDFVYNKNVVKDSIKNCVAEEKTYLLHYGGNFLL